MSEAAFAETQEVWELLAGLRVLRAHLWVGAIGRPSAGISVLLSTNADRNEALLDTLRDSEALQAGDELYFDTQVEGRRLRFECRLDSIAQLEDGPAYRITDPMLVVDQQRRAAYRVRLPATELPRAALLDASGTPLPARVLDVSRDGLGLRVSQGAHFVAGTQINLHVTLPDFDFAADAEVRHVSRNSEGTRLGLQLKLGDAQIEQRLGQAVNRLQRRVLRGR